MSLRSILPASLLLLIFTGCAGPNRVTRSLDLRINQLYVDSPTLATALNPLCIIGMNGAMLIDSCFVNPWYFWNDVQVGRGTAYFYTDPVTPENPNPAAVAEAAQIEPTPTAETKKPEVRIEPGSPIPYTVREGDTLISIAKRYYGDGKKWKKIYMANQNVLTSPDSLRPGQVLVIPPAK